MFSLVFSIVKDIFVNQKTTQILSGLLGQWKLVVVALLVGVIAYQNLWTGPQFLFGLSTISKKEQQISTLVGKLNESVQQNIVLVQAIDKSNKAVEEWKNISKKLEQDQNLVKNELENIKNQTTKDVAKILSDKTPTTCEEAFAYLKDAIPELSWRAGK